MVRRLTNTTATAGPIRQSRAPITRFRRSLDTDIARFSGPIGRGAWNGFPEIWNNSNSGQAAGWPSFRLPAPFRPECDPRPQVRYRTLSCAAGQAELFMVIE